MNVFLNSYEDRLQAWFTLRASSKDLDLKNKCITIDEWWQRVPLVAHYLHPDFVNEWPGPWDLLFINNYCYYARALGIAYTLFLLGHTELELLEAKDDNSNEVVLVSVDRAKYLLNYWPGSVVNIKLQDFSVTRRIDINPLLLKIG